jgi:thiol-disulfide isomerase/thioredoxin
MRLITHCGLASTLALMLAVQISQAQVIPAPPATQPGATVDSDADAVRYRAAMEELRGLWSREVDQLGGGGKVPETMASPAKRAACAPKAIPLLEEELKLIDKIEGSKAIPELKLAGMRLTCEARLLLLNDPATSARVAALNNSAIASDKFSVVSIEFLSRFLATGGDATAQGKLVDEVQALDTANPAETRLAILTMVLIQDAETEQIDQRLMKLLAGTLTSPAAALAKADFDNERARYAALKKWAAEERAKRKDQEGKPITLIGKTTEGKDFSSASLKGKVVLVDFWATWCGPCVAGLPDVKEQYKKYHDQGLEIIGVSDDFEAKKLTDYVAKNDLPWVQLFDPTNKPGKGAALGTQYHISGIPTLFLIDKKGILRSTGAMADMKDLIPKLLAESE